MFQGLSNSVKCYIVGNTKKKIFFLYRLYLLIVLDPNPNTECANMIILIEFTESTIFPSNMFSFLVTKIKPQHRARQ